MDFSHVHSWLLEINMLWMILYRLMLIAIYVAKLSKQKWLTFILFLYLFLLFSVVSNFLFPCSLYRLYFRFYLSLCQRTASWWRLSSRNVLYCLFCYVNAPSSDLLKCYGCCQYISTFVFAFGLWEISSNDAFSIVIAFSFTGINTVFSYWSFPRTSAQITFHVY